MSEATFLEPEEIKALTHRSRSHAQVKVLNAMGIEHKVRPDGSVAILRAHIHKVFDGTAAPSNEGKTKYGEPNWAALNAS